jgi:PAS domain S-box-containing protein
MVVVAFVVGIAVWGILDHVQTRRFENIFRAQLVERLDKHAIQDRLHFSRYIKTLHQSVKLTTSQKKFNDYIEGEKWSPEDIVDIRYYNRPPPWIPERSFLSTFAHPGYALLLDPWGQVKEVYQSTQDVPPQALLSPTPLLLAKSRDQSFMTTFDNIPYVVTSESFLDSKGDSRAVLMLACPIDEEFLSASLGSSAHGHILALLKPGDNPLVLASSHPEKIPMNTPLDTLRDHYLVTGKEFLEYGSSEINMGLVSFISTAEASAMTRSLIVNERKVHAITAIIFTSVFAVIIFWIAQRIQQLTFRISDFSEKTLGVKPHEMSQKGDQLHVLENRFERLTEEVLEAREIIKNEAEEQTRLIVNRAFDAIIAADEKSIITTWNPQAEGIFGWRSEDVMGKKITDTIIPPQYRSSHLKGVKHFLDTGEGQMLSRRIELTALHRDGHEFPVEISVASALSRDKHIFIAIIRDITERKKAEDKIQASLREKEVLLREIHHRVKNNMQIIYSLLRLQSRETDEKKEVDMLLESQNRIRSMSLIHEKLYQSEDLAHIDFSEYIGDLTKELFRSYRFNTDKLVFKADIEDAIIGVDTAIPCGLIINELVSNSLKHAFPGGREGEIQIALRRVDGLESGTQHEKSEMFELTVRDNGIGMPEEMDFRNSESLGLRLVSTLSENQLQGEIQLNRGEGTEFQVRFKETISNE